MNSRENMVIIKGKIKTKDVKFCRYEKNKKMMEVMFLSGQKYNYGYSNVEWIRQPQSLNPKEYKLYHQGHELFNIAEIYVFKGKEQNYWHINFENGKEQDYFESNLQIEESYLTEKQSKNILSYIKQISEVNDMKNEHTGEKILAKKFENLEFVPRNVALSKYLNPSSYKTKSLFKKEFIPIFPFGCNNSQYQAVKNAMENQISVIQGPPGTGKTQTILNIIANILLQGKTVQVVSNNNSATENVYDKLSSSKYNLEFIMAKLGNTENKKLFIENQELHYPNFSTWKIVEDSEISKNKILEKSAQLKSVFDKQERLAKLRQELFQLETEFTYFNEYINELDSKGIPLKQKISSKKWMALWQELVGTKQNFNLIFKIKGFFKYGILNMNFYKQEFVNIITSIQEKYYLEKQSEIQKEISDIDNYLQTVDSNLMDRLCDESMILFKDRLARKYESRGNRTKFSEKDLWKNSKEFLEEYPVILSTTFSSRNSLNSEIIYDYLIMDEASQVDIATGALALSCAKNVVIVGDTKQLPNVVPNDIKQRVEVIFNSFQIAEGYRFTKSFLQSMLDIIPNVTQTLLKEHYRCHPKIINFCNQKFYRGELIIMTEDKGEDNVLMAIKTVAGNHARDHYSQRQVDVIKNEILPNYVKDKESTGIIAPYKNQIEALEHNIKGVDVATVHKFQGKEKDTIIISTVDDEISDFADDPYLINVAVSRAKQKLILVVSGNEQVLERNITDLISYIQYNNFEVTDSKVYSVFDYLYKQYDNEKQNYLNKYKKISEYDSENLMYTVIEDVLAKDQYASIDVVSNFPLNMIFKNKNILNAEQLSYVMNSLTHVDFLLYNRISKKPILGIEVDGYNYHKKGTKQSDRDELKNQIFELYGLPLLRFKTNGSGEVEQIAEALNRILG